jgi:cytidylate kinase
MSGISSDAAIAELGSITTLQQLKNLVSQVSVDVVPSGGTTVLYSGSFLGSEIHSGAVAQALSDEGQISWVRDAAANTTNISFNTVGTSGTGMVIKIACQIALPAADFVL